MHALAAGDSPGSLALGFLLWAAIIAAYWAPSVVALARKVPNKGSVVVVNFFAFALLIPWVIALAMACRSKPPAHGQGAYLPGYPR